MTNWKVSLKVNTINSKTLYHNVPFKQMKKELVKYLRTDTLAKKHLPIRFANEFEKAETEDQYDKVLAKVYDYADDNNIWLGL